MKKLIGKYYYSAPGYDVVGHRCCLSMFSGVYSKDLAYVVDNYTKFVSGCKICHSSDGRVVDKVYTLKEAKRILKIAKL